MVRRAAAVRLTLLVASGGLLSLPSGRRAVAQGAGRVHGVVYDSLISGAPLAGAEVWIEGTNRMARTDPAGRFELAGLIAGHYTLTVDHAVLDSIGLALRPVSVDIAAEGSAVVTLGTPGPAMAHRMLCPHDPWQNAGAVLGLVRDAADGKPLPAVTVTARWSTYTVGAAGVRTEPRLVEARSDRSGRVLLCNVPTDVELLIQGRAGAGSDGMVLVNLNRRAFRRADLQVAATAATGRLAGVVRGANGSRLVGATVTEVGTDRRVTTDAAGGFTLGDVTAGSRIVEAQAIGYPLTRLATTIRPGLAMWVDIVMGDSIHVLEPVTVEGRYQPYLTQVGFEHRRATLQAHFLDTTDVRRSGAAQFEEVFRLVPGVLLRPNGFGYVVELQRGQGQVLNSALANYCPPSYFIDGVYYPPPPIQTPTLPLAPEEVLAIEIYSNVFSAPAQYQRLDSGCGVILVWTKRGVPNRRP